MARVQHHFCLCWSSFVCMNQLLYRCSDILSIETTKEGSVYFGLKFQANTESWWGRQGTRNRECLAILHMQLGNWSRKPSQAIKAQNSPTMILPSAITIFMWGVMEALSEYVLLPWAHLCQRPQCLRGSGIGKAIPWWSSGNWQCLPLICANDDSTYRKLGPQFSPLRCL